MISFIHLRDVLDRSRAGCGQSTLMLLVVLIAAASIVRCSGNAIAQTNDTHGQSASPNTNAAPMMEEPILGHVLFDQLEGRTNGPDNEFRWDGEGWIGTDMNKVWVKSQGFVEHGKMSDGDQEVLYDRPIPHLRYFDVQAGVRYDLDSDPGRTWGAIGIEGLAPYFFEFAPTFYFTNRGFFAGRIEGSYDILITNRLIAQPQIELNFYSKDNPSRGVGSGLSELDAGLRIRYEISRKFAPYIGFAYTGNFGETATFTRDQGGNPDDPRFMCGVRVWY
jgi:copper resistance protein B